MRWHALISGQPAEERHHRRQAGIRESNSGLNAPQQPPLAERKAHHAPPVSHAARVHPECHDNIITGPSDTRHHPEQVINGPA